MTGALSGLVARHEERSEARDCGRVRGVASCILQRESRCCSNFPFGNIGWGRVRMVTSGLNLPRHGIETAHT